MIRQAVAEDWEAWLAVHQAVAAEGRWIGAELPLDMDFERRRFHEHVSDDDKALFLAEVAPADGAGTELAGADAELAGADRSGADADRAGAELAGADRSGAVVVGVLGIHVYRYNVADFGMAVLDGHRGQGIGSALLQAGIDFARAKGAHKVSLQMWPHNEAGRRLYEKFGFEDEGYLRRHYPRKNGEIWDAVIMGLLL